MIKHDFWFSLDLDLVYLFSSIDSNSSVNVIYEPCHWFSCFCAFSKVTVNVLDVIVVRKLSPSKLLCLPPHLIDCHL